MNRSEGGQVRPADGAGSQLRDKIRSKMDIGKFFSGFITLFIGFMLTDGIDLSAIGSFALILLIASLVFMVASMFAYDSLLMPRTFWTAEKTQGMSAIQFQRHLKRQMVRAWSGLFIPGVGFFAIGLVLAVISKLALASDLTSSAEPWVWLGILIVVGFVVPVAQYVRKRPKLYD